MALEVVAGYRAGGRPPKQAEGFVGAERVPPAADRLDGEGGGVVVGADVDPAGVGGQVTSQVTPVSSASSRTTAWVIDSPRPMAPPSCRCRNA
jgi:hypothetical protein